MITLEAVEPIGTHMTRGIGCYGRSHSKAKKGAPQGCHFFEAEVPTYPPAERDLREIRIRRNLSLGACARALGVSVSEYSSLERGRVRPGGETTWDDVIAVLEGA